MLDEAVRFLIIIFIFVFDPLAVLLLVSANISFKTRSEAKKMKKIDQLVQMRRRYKSLQTRHRNYRNKSIKGQPIKGMFWDDDPYRDFHPIDGIFGVFDWINPGLGK